MAEASTRENIGENIEENITENTCENVGVNTRENIVSLHSDRSDLTMGSIVFQVWNKSRSVKKSFAAKSLAHLIEQAAGKPELALRGRVTVTFEKNGTEIDDEEVFTLIAGYPEPPVLVVLSEGDSWEPRTRRV